MHVRLWPLVVMSMASSHASAITVNVDFSSAFFRPGSEYASPAGVQTAGHWNTASRGSRSLRDKDVALSGLVGRFEVENSGSSYFGGEDFSNPNIVLGDAFAAHAFNYTVTGLTNGSYRLFLYARSATEVFTEEGVDLTPISVINLIGSIYSYAYTVDISGGSLALESKKPLTWIAGLQITNDPSPNTIPAPGTVWLLFAALAGLVVSRRVPA